ncbi:MAG: hypothetical protein JO267_12255 [Alphaproteobacteria bacterium]|nr:hypothetical protein [Alphaproteobacteria bacterium]
MSLRQRYLKVLSHLAPAGAVGVALLLGSTAPGAASEPPAGAQPSTAQNERVSERLAAIREAVSQVGGTQTAADAQQERRLAWGNWYHPWGWGYGGYGWPNWNNWHNWPNWGNWFRNW